MLGDTVDGQFHLDRLLAGRILSQESFGAGKSAMLRRLVEEAHDDILIILVNTEGEFENLVRHIGLRRI